MSAIKRFIFDNLSVKLRTALGFSISGVLLWLLIKQSNLEWRQIPELANGIYPVALFWAVITFILTVFLHSVRTRIIFIDRSKDNKTISAFPSLVIGNFYNCLLPANLGEGMRALHFSRVNSVPFPSALAVLIVEKVVDANLSIPLFISIFLFFPHLNKYVLFVVLLIVILIIVCDVVLIILVNCKRLNRVLFGIIPGQTSRKFIYKVYFYFKEHCFRLWRQKTILHFALTAYTMVILTIFQYLLVLKAVKIDPSVSNMLSAYFLSIGMIIISFVPSAPGNTGVAHYGIFASLVLMAEVNGVLVDPFLKSKFLLAAIYLHLSYFIPDILMGALFMIREHKKLF